MRNPPLYDILFFFLGGNALNFASRGSQTILPVFTLTPMSAEVFATTDHCNKFTSREAL